jgi:hypothetical protein
MKWTCVRYQLLSNPLNLAELRWEPPRLYRAERELVSLKKELCRCVDVNE